MDLSELVEQYVESEGITKDKLAERIGISRGALYCKLRGDSEFSLSEAYRIARLLGITVDELYQIAPKAVA